MSFALLVTCTVSAQKVRSFAPLTANCNLVMLPMPLERSSLALCTVSTYCFPPVLAQQKNIYSHGYAVKSLSHPLMHVPSFATQSLKNLQIQLAICVLVQLELSLVPCVVMLHWQSMEAACWQSMVWEQNILQFYIWRQDTGFGLNNKSLNHFQITSISKTPKALTWSMLK